jgi:hypothetical protein
MSEKLSGIQKTRQISLQVKSSNTLSYLRVAVLALFFAFVGLIAWGSLFKNSALCIAALVVLTAMIGLLTCYIVEAEIQNAQPSQP